MTALLIILTLAGCFALARWYGMLVATGMLGLCWGTFAWFPMTLPTAGFVGLGAVLLLHAIGFLRDRRATG